MQSREPINREIVISIDPGTEQEPVRTVMDAVKLMTPKVIEYADRNQSSVTEIIEHGYILGLRGIYLYNYTGVGFALWKPSGEDKRKIIW